MSLDLIAIFYLFTLRASGLQFRAIDGIQCGTATFQPATFTSQRDVSLGKRIVGGRSATPGSWPWQVMLKKDGEVKCGGSILYNNVILTAAHCLKGETNLQAWEVYVGKYHKESTDETERRHTIERFIPHEKFNSRTLDNDIGLLVVKEPIEFTDYVQPICLHQPKPPKNRVRPPKGQCFTTGWGKTKGTGHDDVLKEVQLDRKIPLLCNQFLFGPKLKSPPKEKGTAFCAGYQNADACYGDSGGPYSCKIGGKWYIKGIVSSGRDCGQPGWYGIYANVPMFIGWINRQITLLDLTLLLRSL
ncbi:coagulation factor IX-like isoform X2 [Mercenaria mercenaria]|uniref:coagulation factor IX-like isoform X2 n=1 Tax=Mercenaria mercenaria TaxID=6596 RepID=UPI00234E5FD3|nr:coagulation factor IX-like isoform X2 [Mercenaria mercenaria]